MAIEILNIPNLNDYAKYIKSIQLGNNITIISIFKRIFRSDDVTVDFYIDEISENNKIVTGKLLTANSLLCVPHTSANFDYYINCIDQYGIDESLKYYNAHKFYLQFTENKPIKA